MHIKFDTEMIKKITVYATSLILAILVGLFLFHFGSFREYFRRFAKICVPFVVGFGIAFILRKPVEFFETNLFNSFKRKRLFATLLAFVIFILCIVFMFLMIVPQILDSIGQFMKNYSAYVTNLGVYFDRIEQMFNLSIPSIRNAFSDERLSQFISKQAMVIANYSLAAVRFVFNFILTTISAFYMMLDKENLTRICKKLVYSFFSISVARHCTILVHNAKDIFDRFILGSLIDSGIIGFVTFIGVSVLEIPYAPAIAFVIGVTNLIPVFGPFLGGIPVILLLLLVRPLYALEFLIFIVILQQVDGNILKPIVLGDQLGLSGFWILFSVTIGGGIAGVAGMFLGVPIFALIYHTIRDVANMRLKEKKIDLDEEIIGQIE